MSKKKGPTKPQVVVEPAVATGTRRRLVALGKRHPAARLGLIVTLVVAVGLLVAGLVAPSTARSQMSASDLMTASVDALAGAKYVSFSAIGSGEFLPGPMVYVKDGSNYELIFDVEATLGGAQLLVVNGTPYIKGNATYWKNAKVTPGVWYKWPHYKIVTTSLSGPETLARLGVVLAGVSKGATSVVDGREVVALHYLYTTLYVPLRGSIAPVGFVIAGQKKADISIAFSYGKTKLVAPKALGVPASVRSYFSAKTEDDGWYQSVGDLISSAPSFLGTEPAKKS